MQGRCATYTVLNVYCSQLEPLNEQVCYIEIKNLGPISRPLDMELEYNKELGTCKLQQASLIKDLCHD
jgi:hypothetical protein